VKFKNSIIDDLIAQGKATVLPDEVVEQIGQDIHEVMTAYRRELAKKHAQSERDTAKVVLNA